MELPMPHGVKNNVLAFSQFQLLRSIWLLRMVEISPDSSDVNCYLYALCVFRILFNRPRNEAPKARMPPAKIPVAKPATISSIHFLLF